jgi:hypothetical protein
MKLVALVSLALGCGAPPQPAPAAPSNAPVAPVAPVPVPVVGGLPIGSGAYGTAHPAVLRSYDRNERWMALCQARKDTDGDGKIEVHSGHHGGLFGDAMQLYLILGGGEGTPIEAVPGVSKDGRYLAVVRDRKLWVVDGQTGAQRELAGADVESDGRPGAPHRAAVFSGDQLLYIRHAELGDTLVIHDPATHAEKEVAIADRIWRLVGETAGLAQVVTVPRGQGFPKLMTSLDAGECLGPPMSYSTGGQLGPKPVFTWYALDTGKAVSADGIVAAIGSSLVRAPKDGALYLDGDQLAPPSCTPQLLAVMPSPPRVIAICGQKKQAKILLLGKGLSKELASIDRDTDHYGDLDDMLESDGIVCGSGLHCVATATGAPLDLKGGVTEYVHGTRAYVVHATMSTRTHEIIDVATGLRTPTKGADKKLAAGTWIVDYNDQLVDLTTGKVGGKVKDVLRLGATGRVLRGGGDLQGPLTWSAP